MYHHIAEVDLDPWSVCVTPSNFAQHLEVLQKHYYPMELKQLAQAHREGNIPHRAVAVTFDDGYADNLHHAKPLLQQYNIPATVFVTTGHIGKEREFWWDELERILLQPSKLPQQLRLVINGKTHQWELGKASNYSQEDYQRDLSQNPFKAKSGSRLFFYYSISQLLKPLPQSEQLKALDEIRTWANIEPGTRPTHRSLLPEEVCELDQGEIVEIGAHTVTHPYLSAHSADFQQDEIQRSKDHLEKLLNHPITSFAYPHGNYTPQTVKLIQQIGFSYACTTIEDSLWQKNDCFQFPRVQVKNWNGAEFARRLLMRLYR